LIIIWGGGLLEDLTHFNPFHMFSPVRVTIKQVQSNFHKPASTEANIISRLRGVFGFVRLPLQRNVQQGLKKSADIQGGPVF
jgi:hypothetical protein